MTTTSFSTRHRHDSDAMFREWATEFHNALAAVGLVQTSDTGQINLTTVVRAGTSANAGYEIWRFNDTLQSTAPVFLKVQYGTGGETGTPRLQIGVGTGSNGSGTLTSTGITGTMITERNLNTAGSGTNSSDTAFPSHICHVEGFLGISHKWRSNALATFAHVGQFFLCRTCDNTGTPDGRGLFWNWGRISSTAAARFESPAVAYTQQTATPGAYLGLMPQSPVSTVTGGANQAALAWTITPLSEPLFGLVGVYDSEVTHAGTFSLAAVGSTARTFMCIQYGAPWAAGQAMSTAMIWE